MKKYIYPIILILLLVLMSCRDTSIDEEILRQADGFSVINGSGETERYYGSFLPEINYTPTDTSDIDGIFSRRYMELNNNRLYFSGSAAGVYSYIDLNTGESRLICPDSLCRHNIEECRYVNLVVMPVFTGENIFYTSNNNMGTFFNADMSQPLRDIIYRVDLNNDRVEAVYQTEEDWTEMYINNLYVHNNTLYFNHHRRIEIEGERERTIIKSLKLLDLTTHQIIGEKDFPAEYTHDDAAIMFTDGSRYYFQSMRHIFTTDSNLENAEIIYTFQSNEFLTDFYHDTNTGEFFFLIYNETENTGSIYVYRNSELRKLDMPHDNIVTFLLTADKIYYSIFEPILLGIDQDGDNVYNITAGRIYAAGRDTPENSELFFEVDTNFNIRSSPMGSFGYVIISDYIYFSNMYLINEGAHVRWSRAWTGKVRINIRENTIRHFD
jgi:hypothetical protein